MRFRSETSLGWTIAYTSSIKPPYTHLPALSASDALKSFQTVLISHLKQFSKKLWETIWYATHFHNKRRRREYGRKSFPLNFPSIESSFIRHERRWSRTPTFYVNWNEWNRATRRRPPTVSMWFLTDGKRECFLFRWYGKSEFLSLPISS